MKSSNERRKRIDIHKHIHTQAQECKTTNNNSPLFLSQYNDNNADDADDTGDDKLTDLSILAAADTENNVQMNNAWPTMACRRHMSGTTINRS